MTDHDSSDFVEGWFRSQSPRVLLSGCVVLSAQESDELHRVLLSYSATVWGVFAYYREVVPLIMRGEKEYFGTFRGYSEPLVPVLWVDVGRSVSAAIDLSWGRILQQLDDWLESLADRFPQHFHHKKLGNTNFEYDF